MHKELYFDDLYDFLLYAQQDSHADKKSSRSERKSDWAGGLSWQETINLAFRGWPEGVSMIDKYRAKIFPLIADRVLRVNPVNKVAGYSVDIGLYLSNDPECFISREIVQRNYPGRIIKLVCSMSFSASISPETIIQRGAMICALADALEFAGHRVEVVSNDASSSNAAYVDGSNKSIGWFECSVVVKKPEQPLDLNCLAFCIAHPGMLRRVFFSVCELNGWSDFASNYGYPARATDRGDIYIQEVFSEYVPDSEAIAWVISELQAIGLDMIHV